MFALQVDESTDISGKLQVVTFLWFRDEKSITKQFLFVKIFPR